MKLQLDEKTLNAYIRAALNEELSENATDELFGSRNRKKNIRAITGQGWGNQNRDTKNFWGAANSDISATDSASVAPQTLVGIVTKMENQLMKLEKVVGIAPQAENLGASITQNKNNGGVKVKASLLAAINALGRIADRLNVVEKQTGLNAIMESINENLSEDFSQIYQRIQGATRPELEQFLKNSGYKFTKGQWVKNGVSAAKSTDRLINAAATRYSGFMPAKNPSLLSRAGKAIGNAGKWVATPAVGALGKVGAGVGITIGGSAAVGGAVIVGAIALACFGIAQAAATIATKGRSRNIVRTFNCASILAHRMGNVAEALKEKLEAEQGTETQQQQDPGAQQQQQQQSLEEQRMNELNVRRAKKSFATIEQGMQQLSAMMKQIYAKVNGQIQGQDAIQMPQSLKTPQEIEQFQKWANANNYVDQDGQPLEPDGKFGPKTSYVYDQVAQKLGQQLQESKRQLNEAGGIENALRTLERKVGTTGSGGAAYANISTLSGGQGQGSSRLQNAQNAKAIMRTYPPVLNQYLQILKSAGANVNNLLPLRDDQRPHRNYSVKELQLIDRRIQELIQIAQSFEPQQQNVVLPPKPQVIQPTPPKQQPQPREPELPELDTDIQIEDEPLDIPDEDFSNLDSTISGIKVPAYKNPNAKEQIVKERGFIDDVVDAMRGMGRDNSASLKIKKMGMDNAYRNALNSIDKMVGWGAMTKEEAKEEKKRLKYFYKEFKNGGRDAMFGGNWQDVFSPGAIQQQQTEPATMSEQQFKSLVKKIIKETLEK